MNDQIPFSICCSLLLWSPGLSFFALLCFLLTLVVLFYELHFELAVALAIEAADHFVGILVDIVDAIPIDSSSCSQNLTSFGPLVIASILLEKLHHAIDSDNTSQVLVKCIFLIDSFLLYIFD